MTDDNTKPTGYATLREAIAVIIEHEAERARARPNSSRGKLSLPKSGRPKVADTVGGHADTALTRHSAGIRGRSAYELNT
jgi:hypothetical protein